MTGINRNATEKSRTFKILSGLAIVFFIFAGIGIILFLYLLVSPRSNFATTLLTILSIGPDAQAAVGLDSAMDLLIGAIGALGSLSLSLALAAIYLSQNRILETQADIMNRQKLPLIAAHEDGVQLHDGRPSLDNVTSDGQLQISTSETGPYVSVAVENHGEEAAEQVQMACLVDVPSTDTQRIHTGVTELTTDEMVTEPPAGQGALLPPTKKLTLLYGTPTLSSSPQSVNEDKMFVGGIADQLQKLSDEESDTADSVVRFGFVLIFSNSVNDYFEIPLESAYSVSSSSFEDYDDITINTLKERSIVYNIHDLMEDVNWSQPEDVFVER